MKVTVDQLTKLEVRRDRAEHFADAINAALRRYEIDTPLRVCHWLAQVLHESGRLRYVEEIASGAAYEGRRDLGNTQPGDGRRFKGRGLIQLTGRANYTRYAQHAGIASPETLAERLKTDVFLQVDVAGWYWAQRRINRLADADDLLGVTKAVNGGYNGLNDRAHLLALARPIIKEEPAPPAGERVDVPDRLQPLPLDDLGDLGDLTPPVVLPDPPEPGPQPPPAP